jgi:hypothetical protein
LPHPFPIVPSPRRPLIALAAALVVVATVSTPMGAHRGAAAVETAPASPLEYLGELAKPLKSGPGEQFYVAGFDVAGRRMYAKHAVVGQTPVLATYDLSTPMPTLLSHRPFPATSFIAPGFTTAIAPARGMAYTVAMGAATDPIVAAFDLAGASPITSWSLTERLPGFSPSGMTYSAADDRLYLVGEMTGHYLMLNWLTGRKPIGLVPTVVAVDPGTGEVLWVRPVPECGQVLYTLHQGSAVARSSSAIAHPTIVFGCGTGALGVNGDTNPGQAGVVELRISPTATMAEAPSFDVHFHPISGSYFNGGQTGFAYYDRGSDRLFVQSLSSSTPGAWVFDLRVGGWAGFITAPTADGNYGGVNEGNGHYVMGGTGGAPDAGDYLLIADGRASPPQAGQLADKKLAPVGFVFADAGSDRIFLNSSFDHLSVLRDLTKSADPLQRPDYDAQTDDVDEAEGTFVSFSGDTGGFGARVTMVGDLAGASGPVPGGIGVPSERVTSDVSTPGQKAQPVTRGLLFARVPAANVQPAGASAAAQAASSDTTTGQAVDQNGVAWPFEPRTCLDGGEGSDTPPAESIGGRASVRCNLSGYESVGSAQQSGAGTGPVAIGDSRVDTTVKRTAKGGMVTTTTSSSRGVRIDLPGVGSLEIALVEAVGTTTAHGRSGSASASWTRSLKGVTVKDAKGVELFRSDGCSTVLKHDGKRQSASGDAGTCEALAETVRKLLQVRVRLLFLTAAVAATPKGAFARVGQTDADAASETTVNEQGKVFAGDATTRRAVPALQINVYDDSTERSRYIVQLAGVENSAIYTVNLSPGDAPCDMGGCIPGGFDGLPPAATAEAAAPPGSALEPAIPAAGADLAPNVSAGNGDGRGVSRRQGVQDGGLDGLILAHRSLADGAVMASFLLLLAAATAVVMRRRRLLSAMGAGA